MKNKVKTVFTLALVAVFTLVVFSPAAEAYTADRCMLNEKFDSVYQYGETNYVTLYDIDSVSIQELVQIGDKAERFGGSVIFHFDTLSSNGRSVIGRISVDPELVPNAKGDFNLTMLISGTALSDMKSSFERASGRKCAVIYCNQYSFGMAVDIAAKVNLGTMDKTNLTVYYYNSAYHQFRSAKASYCKVDSNGYVRFNTTVGGYLFITEKAK